MDSALRVVIDKHYEACEALMEHLANKNDEKALEMFDEVIEYAFMSIRFLNDAHLARVKGKV